MFKKLKIIKKRKEKNRKKENSTELQKPNIEEEVYDNKKCVWGEKKKAQKLNWISQCQVNWQLQQREEKNPKESTEQFKI